jgi:hypothetical protein
MHPISTSLFQPCVEDGCERHIPCDTRSQPWVQNAECGYLGSWRTHTALSSKRQHIDIHRLLGTVQSEESHIIKLCHYPACQLT